MIKKILSSGCLIIYLNLKIWKRAPNPPRSEMNIAFNLKGVTKMECELKTKLSEKIKRDRI